MQARPRRARIVAVIANEVEYRATKAHLHQFEEAARNLGARLDASPAKLARLELDAVCAVAGDLQAELHDCERLRPRR